MVNTENILTDSYGRHHNYLRISLTEKCNLRCTYCMPANGVQLTPKAELMTSDEVYEIVSLFVKHGVTKIRLTGGEPFLRKDIAVIIEKLSQLPVELAITTNGVLIDRYIDVLKKFGITKINLSLDTLVQSKFKHITLRDQFVKTYQAIQLLLKESFELKINVVLIKNFNEDELIDFVELTKYLPVKIRFIEFMPFDGNQWNVEKLVSLEEIMQQLNAHYNPSEIVKLIDEKNDTAKNYKIESYKGSFAVISSVSNPFCDTCNRIRLTANGSLKNCLFSSTETSLLQQFRDGKSIEPIIEKVMKRKHRVRGGMDSLAKLKEPALHSQNRSMITIGG
ncbi:MAG: GTP 3',8-cyclase MoaA [Flavobacteriaceae bacterium]|nr:GTP 3',8-cyclase MoaA [Flavobacteriaceae bacterium]